MKKNSRGDSHKIKHPGTGKKVSNRLTFLWHHKERDPTASNERLITLSSGLYVVATPIGNLGDLTLRAWHILNACDYIVCEDTRVARRLFAAHGLKGRFIAYHDHNAQRVRPGIVKQLQSGAAVALISDAGTPLVSDPGLKLVQACHTALIDVFTVPGPNAALAALVVSGLPCDRFFFAGFLPVRKAARWRAITRLRTIPASLIFYERANRVAATLADLAALLGDRPAAVARELTKRHEDVVRNSLFALADGYARKPPRGEIVILIGPPDHSIDDQHPAGSHEILDHRSGEPHCGDQNLADPLTAALRQALQQHSPRDAATLVAAKMGIPKRKAYHRAIELTDQQANQSKNESKDPSQENQKSS